MAGRLVPNLPDDTIAVTTYAQLHRYLKKFAEGELGLVLLLGRHGTGKTFGAKHALEEVSAPATAPLYVEGHVQAFGLYERLWEFRDAPVVLDDVDRLYSDPTCVRLLKPLCSAQREKTLAWFTHATRAGGDIPNQFTTRSHVLLIANEWRTLNANVRALEDRAIILWFAPSNLEVHRQAKTWFDDEEIYSFIEHWLPQIQEVSLRHYEKGRRLRRAGFADWRQSLLQMMLPDPRLSLVARLHVDPAFKNESARIARFIAETGSSRPTYYRLRRALAPLQMHRR